MSNAPMTWTRRQPWMQSARCVDQWDLFDFTVERGHKVENYTAALRICRSCPVLQQCDEFTDTVPAPTGVWAGAVRKKRGPTTTEALCGTTSGYYQHRTRGEETCQRCRDAMSQYQRDLKARRARTGGHQ